MEWLLVVGVVVVAWLFRRHGGGAGSGQLGVGADDLVRRAMDPSDPDGAFMDGYVSARLTERFLERRDAVQQPGPWGETSHDRLPGGADEDGLYASDSCSDPDSDDW
jgi:hypothetical protein